MFAGGVWECGRLSLCVCVCVCVCTRQHACGCLGAWRCFGRKHKAHWPGLETLPFQLTSPAACSFTGLIWEERDGERAGGGGGEGGRGEGA